MTDPRFVVRRLGRVAARMTGTHHSDVAFLGALLGLSVCLNIVLGWRLGHPPVDPEIAARAQTGVAIPAFSATDPDGKPVQVSFAGENPTVLYIFNPKCGWCARNLSNVLFLSSVRGTSFRFVGVSLTDPLLKQYIANTGIKFPVVALSSYGAVKNVLLGATPQTIVVSQRGRILENWMGAYTGDERRRIEAYFSVRLPGLQPGSTD